MAGYIGSKASVVSSGAEHKKLFNITTTTTSLTGLVYTPTLVHVFHNGVRLVDGTDYTATNGTSITLTVAAENGDQVAVVSYATFQTSDTVSASAGGTFGNSVTMSSGAVVNRQTTDGTIIDLQKDGTTVGSIGVASGQLTIGDGDLGLIFNEGGSDRISPWNISSGASSDAAIDLGETYGRFKDLYLSGGVYLGGTGAANKLDDYEEGTSSGTLLPNSGGSFTTATYTGRYRKISSLVHFSFEATITTLGGGNTGFLIPLPFTADGSFGYSGTGRRMTDSVQFHTVVDGTTYLLARNTAAGGTLEAGSTTYKGMIIYYST